MEYYEHGGDIYGYDHILLDFSVNTNPLGMPENLIEAVQNNIEHFSKYPDPHCRRLREKVAGYEGVSKNKILCGNGAADLIYRLCYALKPQKALICAPTFSEYASALKQVNCRIREHVLLEEENFSMTCRFLQDMTPDLDLIFLCQPNNPTGQLIPMDILEEIVHRALENETILAVDECFLDFSSGKSMAAVLDTYPNLVILKAFTKIYAMAGLRLGYSLSSNTKLLEKINKAGQSWSVSVPAQIAGIAALENKGWIEKTRSLAAEERIYLTDCLTVLGCRVFPSDANFLLFACDKPLFEPLIQKGILIRSCCNFKGLDKNFYRIGVKTRNENQLLIQKIKDILNRSEEL